MLQTLVLFCLLFGGLSSLASPTNPSRISLPVAERMEGRSIGRSIYLLPGEASTPSESDVLAGALDEAFVLSDRDLPNQGLLSSERWIRFTLSNSSSTPIRLLLESRYSLLDSITLYRKASDGTFQSLTLGDQHDAQFRPVSFRLPVFPLDVAPGEQTYYVRIETKGTLMVAFFLWDEASFREYDRGDSLVIGFGFGSLLILTIYNTFLAISFRSRTYAIYVVYLISFIGTQLGLQATGLYWIGGEAGMWVNNRGFLASVTLNNVLALIFTSLFLDTRTQWPRWHKVLLLLTGTNLVVLVICFLGDYNLTARLASPVTVVTSLSLISLGVSAAIQGFRPAIYYTLAWLTLLSNNILLTLMFNGLYPMTAIVQYGNLYGGIIEAALLSLGLADRVTYLQKKSELTIQHLNDELRQNFEKVEAIVVERTETIRTIIDNVKSGFFTMRSNGCIEAGFTQSCEILLGRKIQTGTPVIELLAMPPEQAKVFRLAIQQVFDDQLIDEVAISQIPKTYRLGKRVLKLEGSVVRDNSQKAKLILFTLTDITRLMRKQREAFRSSMLLRILRNMDAFRAFITFTRNSLEELQTLDLVRERAKVNFILHTIKGNSLVFKLTAQARLVHELEDQVLIEPKDIEALTRSFTGFLDTHKDILKLSWGAEDGDCFVITHHQLDELDRQLGQHLEDPGAQRQWRAWLQHATAKSARSLLGPLEEDIHNLAARLNKKVSLQVVGDDQKILTDKEQELVKNLLHLVRNALIHGIEADRVAVGKPIEGRIQLTFVGTPQELTVILQDDGQGFPLNALRSHVIERGRLSKDRAMGASVMDLLAAVGSSGFSTQGEADIYAGRGFGLASVHQNIVANQGQLEIETTPGQGTCVRMSIPRTEASSSTKRAS